MLHNTHRPSKMIPEEYFRLKHYLFAQGNIWGKSVKYVKRMHNDLYKSVTLAIESPNVKCRNGYYTNGSPKLHTCASKDIFFATFRVLNK